MENFMKNLKNNYFGYNICKKWNIQIQVTCGKGKNFNRRK